MGNDQRGIICILLAMILYTVQDSMFKLIADHGSVPQVFVMRGIIGGILITSYLAFSKRRIHFGTAYPVRTILRGLLFTSAYISFYCALPLMPLAEAMALFFISPIFISIFSVFFFKTKIGLHRAAAIFAGFCGMLLVVKPDPEMFSWASLLPIYCAFAYSLSMLIAKQTSEKDTSFQQALHMYLAAIVFGGLLSSLFSGSVWAEEPILAFVLRPWQFELNFVLLASVIISFAGSIAIALVITAYRVAEPSLIAPFEYLALLLALLVGYFVFDEAVGLYSLLGMGLIVASGAYIFWREGVRKKPIALETSLRN